MAQRSFRSAVLTGPQSLRVETQPLGDVPPSQVRVRLEGCGVCGSNLPVWEGRPWFQYPLAPGAPGHEGWGQIDAVGAEVDGLRVGDRVALMSQHAFAEYDFAEAAEVVKLPEKFENTAFPGEPLACTINAFRRCEIETGQYVAVIGIGFLGALLVQLAAGAGARVIAISRRPFALEIARRMGAVETIGTGDRGAVINAVHEITGGQGCPRVIEATGFQEPLDLAGELTAERGRLIIAGYHQDGLRQVNMQLWNWRGLDVVNAHERDPKIYVRGMREAVEAVAAGRLDPSPLFTHQFKLEELGDALSRMSTRPDRFLKALLTYA